jgi:hypothetical protein
VNVLGHAALLEGLIEQHKLANVAVFAGSEAARGVPKLRIPRPAFASSSVNESASVINGSYYGDTGSAAPQAMLGQVTSARCGWGLWHACTQSALRDHECRLDTRHRYRKRDERTVMRSPARDDGRRRFVTSSGRSARTAAGTRLDTVCRRLEQGQQQRQAAPG